MKKMIILLVLITFFGPSIAGAQARDVGVRSGFVARPGFSRGAFFPRQFVALRPGFSHRGIFPGAFVPYAYPYTFPPYSRPYYFYPYPYSYSLYSYTGYPNHPGYLTPDQINSARSYSTSVPPPAADVYDRGYAEGYAQGYEQAQKEADRDRYDEGKQRGYQEGYEAGKGGENP
jgi:hypothetical protein